MEFNWWYSNLNWINNLVKLFNNIRYMIPDNIVRRFNIKSVYALHKNDHILSYGFPCIVNNLKFDYNTNLLNINCRNVITNIENIILLNKTTEIIKFEPEKQEHIVVYYEDEHALTDTDMVLDIQASIGDIIHSIVYPISNGNIWTVYNKIVV